MTRSAASLPACLVLAAAACAPDPSPPPPPPIRYPNAAAVYGRVTDDVGRPVPGVTVVVVAVDVDDVPPVGAVDRVGECSGAAFPPDSSRTGSDGRYGTTLDYGVGPEYTACITATVLPPAGSGLAAATTSGLRVRFRARHPSEPPRDSVRIDFTLH